MTQQPEPAQPRSNQIPDSSKPIDKPPDKRKPAPVGDRDGRKFDYIDNVFERKELTKPAPSNASLAPAIARRSDGLDLYDATRISGRGPSELLLLSRRYEFHYPVEQATFHAAMLNEWGGS